MTHDLASAQAARGLEPLRQATIDRLTDAFAADYISMDEYERRAALASSATMPAALDELVVDLPAQAPRPESPGVRPRSRLSSHLVGAPPVTTGCVMGDRHLTGNWLTSDRVSTFTVMGSTKIDLRDSDLPPGATRIEVFNLMGETQIVVPRDLPVRLSAFALMAESRADRNVNQQTRGADSWIEVSGFVMMGELRVRALD